MNSLFSPGRPRRPSAIPSLLAAACCLALSACGGSHSPTTGRVLYQGKPAEGAIVIFHPKDGESRPTAPRPTGVADADGRFSLESIRTPGAPPGSYVVTITWPGAPAKQGKVGLAGGEDERAAATDRLGGRYADRAASKIEATIKPGRNALEAFNLE